MRRLVKQHFRAGPTGIARVGARDDDVHAWVDGGIGALALAEADDVDANRRFEPLDAVTDLSGVR